VSEKQVILGDYQVETWRAISGDGDLSSFMEDAPDDTREPETPIWTQLLEAAQDSDDPEYVAKKVAALDRIIRQAKEARADAGDHLVAVMDGYNQRFMQTDEVRIEVRTVTPRTAWQWDDLWPALDRQIATAPRLLFDGGEVEGDHARALRLARTACPPLGQSSPGCGRSASKPTSSARSASPSNR
jgi:hypothetical protein